MTNNEMLPYVQLDGSLSDLTTGTVRAADALRDWADEHGYWALTMEGDWEELHLGNRGLGMPGVTDPDFPEVAADILDRLIEDVTEYASESDDAHPPFAAGWHEGWFYIAPAEWWEALES